MRVLSAPKGAASFQMKCGATTAHRACGLQPGFCGWLRRDGGGGSAFGRLLGRLSAVDLTVFDEFSMLGQAFIGKILFRARDAQPEDARGSLFGLDVIKAGHLAQAAPIGDDPVYKSRPYTGKGLNKPPSKYSGRLPPSYESFVQDARLFLEEFEDVAMFLETHRVDEEGDLS